MKNNQVLKIETNLASFLQNEQVHASLAGIRRGIERELIRTQATGGISDKTHPVELGSALTHPYITTDFSEAQLELVTPAMDDRTATFDSLASLHHFVATRLPEGETLWGASMPPQLPNDETESEDAIRIASYGTSNAGLLKKRYREGLANRYGKRMQLISGIHYNFSLPEAFWIALYDHQKSIDSSVAQMPLEAFVSERYFHMIRNVLRHGWLVPYLFGASPAVDNSYLQGKAHALEVFDDETCYLPWATSLRLSNLGYSSDEQSSYPISFNNRQQYLSDLHNALTRPSERYLHLDIDQQMNGSVLQLENELYGSVRPKIVNDTLRPLYAMCHYGVQYVELRSMDNNPYLPLGIAQEQSHFLDLFLVYSALAPSPELTEEERAIVVQRQELVATQGRKPDLTLPTLEGEVSLETLGLDLLDAIQQIAALFDDAFSTDSYQTSIFSERMKLQNSDLTPSAKLLAQMKNQGLSHQGLMQRLSDEHLLVHLQHQVETEKMDNLTALVDESLSKQQQMERQPDISFDDFLKKQNQLQRDCKQQEMMV